MVITEKIILPSDPEAATLQTIEVWVDRHGNPWKKENEYNARWSGATHTICPLCKCPVEKNRWCIVCYDKKVMENFLKKEKKKWDESCPAYSIMFGYWFSDWDEVEQYCEDEGLTAKDYCLVIGDPVYPDQINPDDYYNNDLPEEVDSIAEIDPKLAELFKQLNDYIAQTTVPLSYVPGKYRVKL